MEDSPLKDLTLEEALKRADAGAARMNAVSAVLLDDPDESDDDEEDEG